MERFQMLQNFCQLGILLSVIIGGLCTYGSSYFGRKKEELKKNIEIPKTNSNTHVGNTYNITGDYVENKKVKKVESQVLNAPSALIVTKDQRGGQNTVNFFGGKPNPANIEGTPIFESKGYYGENILNSNLTKISKDKDYSFSANIPDNTKLKVTLSKIGENKSALWFMGAFSHKNWKYSKYQDGEQQYDLDDINGDMLIFFKDTGSAKMNIYFNDILFNYKIIHWN